MLPPSPTIDRCKTGVLAPLALLAGAKLDVFTSLSDGPIKPEQLAKRIGVDPEWLRPLLFALAAAGLLQHEEGLFRNADEAEHYLVRGKPHFIGDVHRLFEELWRGAFLAAESVRAGKPLAAHDYNSMSPVALADFFAGQHSDSLLAGWKLADVLDLSGAHRLVDFGGGSGGVAIALCQHFPGLEATVVELPAVTTIAKRYIDEAGLSDRIALCACDALNDPLPSGYDVAVVRSFLQVLSPRDCVAALTNLRPALSPGAQLFILGQIADDDRVNPEPVALFNLIFLSFYTEGRVYTESEHREWLTAAGFVKIERQMTPNGLNMMTARAPT